MAFVGPPTAAGTFNFTLRAQNQAGHVDTAFVLTVLAEGGSQTPTSVRITPENAGNNDHVATMSVSPGTSVALYGIVWDATPAPIPGLGVVWAITGTVSTGTSISQDGVLTVASGETAATFTVTATHNGTVGTTTVTVE